MLEKVYKQIDIEKFQRMKINQELFLMMKRLRN